MTTPALPAKYKRVLIQCFAFDPRTWVTWHATDTYPYTMLERVRLREPDISEAGLRKIITVLVRHGLLEEHERGDRWKLTQTGSDYLAKQ